MNDAVKYAEDGHGQAANWLNWAIQEIDQRMEQPGYAKAHPELLAAMVQAAALDYHAGRMADAMDRHSQGL